MCVCRYVCIKYLSKYTHDPRNRDWLLRGDTVATEELRDYSQYLLNFEHIVCDM